MKSSVKWDNVFANKQIPTSENSALKLGTLGLSTVSFLGKYI